MAFPNPELGHIAGDASAQGAGDIVEEQIEPGQIVHVIAGRIQEHLDQFGQGAAFAMMDQIMRPGLQVMADGAPSNGRRLQPNRLVQHDVDGPLGHAQGFFGTLQALQSPQHGPQMRDIVGLDGHGPLQQRQSQIGSPAHHLGHRRQMQDFRIAGNLGQDLMAEVAGRLELLGGMHLADRGDGLTQIHALRLSILLLRRHGHRSIPYD